MASAHGVTLHYYLHYTHTWKCQRCESAVSPFVTGMTGDIRGLKQHVIKRDWIIGFMKCFIVI